MRVMQRVSSTVVCVVGGDDSAIDPLRHKANIVVYQPDPSAPAMMRAVEAWDSARRTHSAYFVHDADPLVSLADAWGGYFEGTSPVGELEIVASETLARWRAGSIELPDYYLVFSAEDWAPTASTGTSGCSPAPPHSESPQSTRGLTWLTGWPRCQPGGGGRTSTTWWPGSNGCHPTKPVCPRMRNPRPTIWQRRGW